MNRDQWLSIVVPEIQVSSGTRSYSENVLTGLARMNVDFKLIKVKKREISIRGKPYFGFISQYISSFFKFSNTELVHSLSPDCIIRGTNIVTVHDIIPMVRKDIYYRSKYDKVAFTRSLDRILDVPNLLLSTEVGKREMIEKKDIDEGRLHVLHHAVDHGQFFPTDSDPYGESGRIKVLMVGDFNPRKRIDIAVKALKGHEEIDFYHIGPTNAWEDRYREITKMAYGAKNIHFLGQLSVDSLRDYLSHADLFLYLTEAEGFGLPPIEALACGTNVLVSNIDVFHETLQNMADYVENDRFSSDSIMSALRGKRKSNDLVNYSKKFSIEKYVGGLLELYNSLRSSR